MKRRNGRQEAIRDIIRTSSVRTQRSLVEALRDRGFDCTQATVSRDVADMGLCKLPEGVYVLAEDLHLQRMLSDFVSAAVHAQNLVVVRCSPGTASGVAAAIDDAGIDHAIGSIGGDDTVLLVAETEEDAALIAANIRKLSGAPR